MTLFSLAECAIETGYSVRTLETYRGRGGFVEPDKRVGIAGLYDPKKVRAWKREHLKRRDVRGRKPPGV
jgi:hypothetical protein